MYQPNFPEFWVEWKAPLVYIILINIRLASAWNEYGLKKKLDARAFFFSLGAWKASRTGHPSSLACLPRARPFFLNPYSFQAPATQVMNISD